MENEIIGKVIKIINEDTLIIHTPKKNVKRGDKISIVSVTIPIIEPETKEKLGTYYLVKEDLEVVSNHQTYVVAQNILRGNNTDILKNIDMVRSRSFIKSLKLKVDLAENENIKVTDTKIKLGDSVIFQK